MTIRLLILAICTILLGCHSVIPADRDQSGQFDGLWQGRVELTQEFQSFGHWEYACTAYRVELELDVKEGYVNGRLPTTDEPFTFKAPISSAGRFQGGFLLDENESPMVIKGRLSAADNKGEGSMTLKWPGRPGGCVGQWVTYRRSSGEGSGSAGRT